MGFGPPPKPDAQRRRRNKPLGGDVRRLPPEGRPGPPPAWPLPGRPGKARADLWAQLWSTPQAVAWERLGWTRVVARYVLLVLAAEKADAKPMVLAEARQMEDRLGLTPMAMLRLRWEVGPVEDRPASDVPSLDDYRAALG